MTNKTIKNKYQLSPLNKEYNEHDYIEPFNINYLLFKNDIYRLIKFNDIRFILKNMTSKEIVYI